jgi:hypothetical protein
MEKPLATTIILCDQIMREEVNGKYTLVGVFSTMQATKFPCYCPALCVFTALTNGRGPAELEMRCVHAVSGAVIGSMVRTEDFADPTSIREVTFVMRGLTFPEEGIYSFELRTEGELLAETRCRMLAPYQPAAVH